MRALLVASLIVGLALLVRLPGVGEFMTVDEATWMVRSHDFMRSLSRGDIAGTFQGTHPGATAMWLIGSGVALQEWRLGTTITADNLVLFHKAAVMPIMVATALLVGVIAGMVSYLFGRSTGLVAGILLACEPYLIGMSQVAHLDALQALLMLSGLLLWACYLERPRRGLLYATGVVLGLALGVKLLLALWLLPSFIGMAVLQAGRQRRWILLRQYGLGFVATIGIALAIFVILWPAILTKADLQLGYISRDTVTIVTDEHGAYQSSDSPIDLRTFYLRTALGRSSPYVQILVLGGGIWMLVWGIAWFKRRLPSAPASSLIVWMVLWLLLYSGGFLVFITFAAKKADRYALPALAAWPVIASLVLVYTWPLVERRFSFMRRWRVGLGVLGVLGVAAIPLLWSPYAIAYNNPLFPMIRPLTQQGWGEGLESAAEWLNAQPGAKDMYIASWYPSVMRTYFGGKTMNLSFRSDYRAQYIVTYRNMGGRAGDDQASDVLDEVRDQRPVHTIFIQGVPYVSIYPTDNIGNFTRHVGELVGSTQVGQAVFVKQGSWSKLDIGFGTFGDRQNTEEVILHIRESAAQSDIRTVRVNAGDISNTKWHRFEFEPIEVAADREYYVVLESPSSQPGNAITVRYTEADVSPGQLHLNGQPIAGDMAYRIP